MTEDNFSNGFMFGLALLKSMGCTRTFEEVVAQLQGVARGDLTLQPTPAESIEAIEAETGKPLPDGLRRSASALMLGRGEVDVESRAAARSILGQMGVDVD